MQRYRRRADLTQEELAERGGYSANYLSKLERDQRSLPKGVIRRLAAVLALRPAERGVQRPPLSAEQGRRRLFAGLCRYLRTVAGEAGTLLVLDDLQWAGADALDLLAALVTSGETPPVRILGAYRDTEPAGHPLAGLLADLARASLVELHPLGPLSDADVKQLLNGVVPADLEG